MQSTEAATKKVAVGLIWRGRYLVVGRRNAVGPLAGCDEFPGGKLEPGELPEAAVVRECLEETGLEVHVLGLRKLVRHCYSHGALELHFFDCECSADNPFDLIPRAPFRWVDLREVMTLRFPEANAELLAELCDGPRR